MAGKRDAVAAVAAGRAVKHGNVHVRDRARGAPKGGRRRRDGLVKVHLDRAARQVQHREYGRHVDGRGDRVGQDPELDAGGGGRRVAGQVVQGPRGKRQRVGRQGIGCGRQGRLLGVREQYAQCGRRRRLGLGRRGGRGRAGRLDRCAGERDRLGQCSRDVRAGKVDPRRVGVLVEQHGEQAVGKVKDGRRRIGRGRGGNRGPARVGRDEQVRPVQPRKVVVRPVVDGRCGHGQVEVAVGEQRKLCALGQRRAKAHLDCGSVRGAGRRSRVGCSGPERERVRARRAGDLNPRGVAWRGQADGLAKLQDKAARVKVKAGRGDQDGGGRVAGGQDGVVAQGRKPVAGQVGKGAGRGVDVQAGCRQGGAGAAKGGRDGCRLPGRQGHPDAIVVGRCLAARLHGKAGAGKPDLHGRLPLYVHSQLDEREVCRRCVDVLVKVEL